MMTGKIATLTDKNFGFIKVEGREKDLFFHANDLKGVSFDQLKKDDVVTFDVEEGQKGPAAKNVSLGGQE